MGKAVLSPTKGVVAVLLIKSLFADEFLPLDYTIVRNPRRSDLISPIGHGEPNDGTRNTPWHHTPNRLASSIVMEIPRDDLTV